MTIGPYPLDPVEARLRGEVSALRLVGNAADLHTALSAQPKAVPAAYVLRTERGDEPHGYSGGDLVQRMRVAVQVVLWVRNYAATDTGAGARAEMDALQSAVRQALINWQPSGDFDVLSLEAERDESFNAGSLVAQSVFRTNYRLQTEATP